MIDDCVWWDCVTRGAKQLSGYLVKDYQRQPHVTILPAGFIEEGEVDPQRVMTLCQKTDPFNLSLGPMGSFTGSPCYPIHDPGQHLSELRTAFRKIAVDPNSQVGDHDYMPHLTVGLYDDVHPTEDVAKEIRRLRHPASTGINITEISLLRYQCSTIKGPLETVAKFKLGKRAHRIAIPTPFKNLDSAWNVSPTWA